MEKINDYYRYTQLMRNGFYDKLFFIDKLFEDWKSLIDYGCADGFLTKMIANIFPDKAIMGYDDSEEMIKLAYSSGDKPNNVRFTSAFTGADVIYLSSMIHEVYSYKKDQKGIDFFWGMVFNNRRRYVVIRDMGVRYDPTPKFDTTDTILAIKNYCRRINAIGEVFRFEEKFGKLEGFPYQVLHLLLKLPYISSPNWNRELNEDYIPISFDRLMNSYVPENWEVEYSELYQLPYLKYWWKKEIGITVPYTTHMKLIIKNKNF
jgi:hypothetical protein